MKPEEYVVYDLETTGFHYEKDEITQISALKIRAGNIVESFDRYLHISGSVPFQVSELTGITDSLLTKEGVSPKQALTDFAAFCRKSEEHMGKNPFFILIAHNGKRFDSRFLAYNAEKWNVRLPVYQLDSLILAKAVLPKCKSYKLGDLAERVNASAELAHRADADTKMLYDVLEKELFLHSTKEALRKACFATESL